MANDDIANMLESLDFDSLAWLGKFLDREVSRIERTGAYRANVDSSARISLEFLVNPDGTPNMARLLQIRAEHKAHEGTYTPRQTSYMSRHVPRTEVLPPREETASALFVRDPLPGTLDGPISRGMPRKWTGTEKPVTRGKGAYRPNEPGAARFETRNRVVYVRGIYTTLERVRTALAARRLAEHEKAADATRKRSRGAVTGRVHTSGTYCARPGEGRRGAMRRKRKRRK